MAKAQYTNRLDGESSPYLRQHAHNPVDWYPWGEEALERARTADRPILLSHGDLSQNVVLSNNDIVFVPRSFMGDVNDVITKIEPLLNVLLIPATYRDLYTTGGGLRVDTGEPAVSSTTQGFTRPLPGVGKLVVPPVEEEEEGEEQDGDGEQEE